MNILIYTRVSTEEQTVEPQRLELTEYCSRNAMTVVGEFTDVLSGSKADRPGMDALLARCKAGGVDVVVAVKLDRLGRSVLNVITLIAQLEAMGVAIICTSQGIDTRKDNPCGRMQYQIIAAVAEFERNLIRERTVAGLKVAKKNGKVLGRPSQKLVAEPMRSEIVALWRSEGGKGVRELAKRLGGVSPATAAKLVNQLP